MNFNVTAGYLCQVRGSADAFVSLSMTGSCSPDKHAANTAPRDLLEGANQVNYISGPECKIVHKAAA
jgi:hypothetical protein